MRIESSVTTLSWIPSEAVTGANKSAFEIGFTHYDDPPPDVLGDLDEMRNADMFRFANRLAGWAEVHDGRVVDAGYSGAGFMGSTTIRLAGKGVTFAAVELPLLRDDPVITPEGVTFVQTYGGRTALPAPRRVPRPPFVQFRAPLVWTTLALTVKPDGSSTFDLAGASPFPRHWVYDDSGKLTAKAGLADFKQWARQSFGRKTPWGSSNSTALVTAVETALERELSGRIMRGGDKPKIRTVKAGQLLTEQGAPGDEVYLVLDGVLAVEVDGQPLAEIGPGAILGERAVLEGGVRTSTLRAVTKCRVAVAQGDQFDRELLEQLSSGHRRESDG
ncbi:MAG: putative transcriptional regulator, Crp/Fnr family [Actinomycetia bacterium]|nr:putative transcriptional regulator, Crp/Fnr family [Actinomycetes bacterium]